MTSAAINEAAKRHADATKEWHAALLARRQAREAIATADTQAEIAGKKLRDAVANYERLMGADSKEDQ